MAKRGPLNMGGGRFINRSQAKRNGINLLNAGTMRTRRYSKSYRKGSTISRSLRIPGTRKSVSKAGERFIVGGSKWNSSSYRRRQGR